MGLLLIIVPYMIGRIIGWIIFGSIGIVDQIKSIIENNKRRNNK